MSRSISLQNQIINIKFTRERRNSMKRFIMFLLLAATVISCFSLSVFAASYQETRSVDFTSAYNEFVADGAVRIKYCPGMGTAWLTASTELSVSNDATGTAYIYVKAINNETNSTHSSTQSHNVINSGTISVFGQLYAKETNHYAYRITDGTIVDWRYICK